MQGDNKHSKNKNKKIKKEKNGYMKRVLDDAKTVIPEQDKK